jgi:hypothetical protein
MPKIAHIPNPTTCIAQLDVGGAEVRLLTISISRRRVVLAPHKPIPIRVPRDLVAALELPLAATTPNPAQNHFERSPDPTHSPARTDPRDSLRDPHLSGRKRMVTEMLSPDRDVSSMTSSSALGNGTGARAGAGSGAGATDERRRPGVVDLELPPPPP